MFGKVIQSMGMKYTYSYIIFLTRYIACIFMCLLDKDDTLEDEITDLAKLKGTYSTVYIVH